MTNRDRIIKRMRTWKACWLRAGITPSIEMAYVAGWLAAERERARLSKGKNNGDSNGGTETPR